MALLGTNSQRNGLLQNMLSSYVGKSTAETFRKQPMQYRQGMARKVLKRSPINSMRKDLINVSRSKTNIIRAESKVRTSINRLQHHRVGRAFQNIG